MKKLNSEQLKQVSAGIILGVSDVNTFSLVLSPNDFFFFANYKTADTYMFMDNGDVLFMNPLSSAFYPVSFPFKIADDQLCEYLVPSSLFKFST